MFPLWEVAVAPALEAAAARQIVEIGALRGENTRLMIDRLGPETVLHVIDPLPDFDPGEHEREFAGQYVFHRDLSLNVLGSLPPMDAALIDGDHNWYTVYNELRMLRETARATGSALPLLILHDVGWPYGRRDLYYDPSNIPTEFRRDWAYKGMEPGKRRLVPFGAGLNPTLANARVDGGRRNGVRTGLDDFVAEHDRPMRQVVLPIYFGLAIVVEQERLERQPELAAVLDHLESVAGKEELLEVAEEIRLQSLIFQHKIYFDRDQAMERAASRYLEQLKDMLTGDIERGVFDELESSLDRIRAEYALGDIVSVGVGRPEPVLFLRGYLEAHELRTRQARIYGPPGAAATAGVAAGLERHRLVGERTHLVEVEPGSVPDEDQLPEQVAVLWIGPSAGPDSVLVEALAARLMPGGLVVVDPEAPAAVRDLAASVHPELEAMPPAAVASWQVGPRAVDVAESS